MLNTRVSQPQTEKEKTKPSLLGMVTSPIEKFQRIRETPKIFFPLMLLVVLYICGAGLLAFGIDYTTLFMDTAEEQEALIGDEMEIIMRVM